MEAFIPNLKLTLESSTLIQPSKPTERRTMFLSNIDQSFNFHAKAVEFFPAIPNLPLLSICEMLKLGFAELLVSYDFLAGRLMVNEDSGRLEIDCNGAGVSFVVASTELILEDIGELGPNNPVILKKLTPMPELGDQLTDQPLFALQVTCFRCGNYALGLSYNHVTLDGTGIRHMFQNLTSILSGQPHLAIPPFNDRRILAARSLPRVSFPHHLTTLDHDIQRLPISTTPTKNLNKNKVPLQFKEFHLSAKHISFLKAKARNLLDAGGVSSAESVITTTFNVVTAHIWRSKALATNDGRNNYDKPSSLIYPVDMRGRPNSPFPASYSGNGILPAYASATYRDLEVGPFSRIVEMVAEGTERMNDHEYVKFMVDCGMEKGFPMGDVSVTSWRWMAFEELDFGLGRRPTYMCRLPLAGSEIILLYSGVGAEKGSVTALVGLPSKCLEKFEHLYFQTCSKI